MNNLQKLQQIVDRCQAMLDEYGADTSRRDRELNVHGIGKISKYRENLSLTPQGLSTVNLSFVKDGDFKGFYPMVEQLEHLETMLDKMKDQIDAVNRYLKDPVVARDI